MSRHDTVLIASASGRALAASARKAGYRVFVLDAFNDADTRGWACKSQAVAWQEDGFEASRLMEPLTRWAHECQGLVYGSGFEAQPGLLSSAARHVPIWGNDPDTVAAVKDPQCFFGLLDTLAIPHPQIQFAIPPERENWLSKRIGGTGGAHVQWTSSTPASHRYFQRHAPGLPMSALFLADGINMRLLGYNEQLLASSEATPFRYGGAIARVRLPDTLHNGICASLKKLVGALGLRGLNGLDFLMQGKDFCVLEINPRPPATFELYEMDSSLSLVDVHIRACQGELGSFDVSGGTPSGSMIVYAPCTVQIPSDLNWPAWVADRPDPGSTITRDMPVCSIHAQAANADSIRQELKERGDVVRSLLSCGLGHPGMRIAACC
jgi:predicted ATP-grasp superfamily ATP-dependent carboligase